MAITYMGKKALSEALLKKIITEKGLLRPFGTAVGFTDYF